MARIVAHPPAEARKAISDTKSGTLKSTDTRGRGLRCERPSQAYLFGPPPRERRTIQAAATAGGALFLNGAVEAGAISVEPDGHAPRRGQGPSLGRVNRSRATDRDRVEKDDVHSFT